MSADSQVTRHGDATSYFFWSDGVTDNMTCVELKNDRNNEVYLHKLWLYAPGAAKVVIAITRNVIHSSAGTGAGNALSGVARADHRDAATTGLAVAPFTANPTISAEETVLGRIAVQGPFTGPIPIFDFPGKAITVAAAGSLFVKILVGGAAQLAVWGEVSDF